MKDIFKQSFGVFGSGLSILEDIENRIILLDGFLILQIVNPVLINPKYPFLTFSSLVDFYNLEFLKDK